ncbi:glycosyltransferase [Paenibacillus humicola]|uniref:glycosyltransferase n=1 Tax=Paenibacillus humicola TaxID=3110540 RepID=UPI00237A64C5|nr:glycosyltransferase [Paenibacillus humicola]
MGDPYLTVIVPVHEDVSEIAETIDSILTQDYPWIELLAVDCSVHGNPDLLTALDRYGGKRLRIVRERGLTRTAAFNQGISLAEGGLLGWLNPGDRYLPGAVRTAVQALEANRSWAMLYGGACYRNERGDLTAPYPTRPFDPDALMEDCFLCQPAVFFHKEAAIAAGKADESLELCANYDLWIRISKSFPVGYIQQCLATTRLYDDENAKRLWKEKGLSEVFRLSRKNYGTVAWKWAAEYAECYKSNEVSRLFEQLKAHGIFKPSAIILSSDRYPDNWLPYHANITLQMDPADPVHVLRIKGSHDFLSRFKKLHFTARVNGFQVGSYEAAGDSFVIEIPIRCSLVYCNVELHTHERFNPAEQLGTSDFRDLGFVAEDITALTAEEYRFYQTVQRGL